MKQNYNSIVVNIGALKDSRELYEKNERVLEAYISRLLEWNEKINLVSRTVSRETVREHVVHSLIPVALDLVRKHDRWVDSGTGGGLPGIPLAITDKRKFWYLNDNVKKKMRAVSDIVESIKLQNVEVVPKSISLFDLRKGTGIMTKHAFKIDDILRLLGSKPWKTILMWKGVEGAKRELEKSKKNINCTIYEFDFGKDEPFYEGKGLIKIER